MKIVDRIFLVVFAQYRRKVDASDIEAAWRGASNKVSGFLVLPLVSLLTLVTLAAYSFKGIGVHIEQNAIRAIQILGGVIVVIIAVLLDRRFKKFLLTPPMLTSEESRDEKLLVFRFRAIAIGIFVLVCFLGALWHRIGSDS